jgi:lambda family phage portal protein
MPDFAPTNKAYDAIGSNKRRRKVAIDTRTEDKMLLPLDREQLISNSRSLRRNSAIAAFAIRKHLDYVATFNFQCRSGIPEFDREVENLMAWWSRPFNCDVTGRFSLLEIIRMLEGLATTDGDAFIYKLADGHVQLIEGDRIKTPTNLGDFTNADIKVEDFTHGVKLSPAGRPLQYAICERTGGFNTNGYNQFKLQEIADARNLLMRAYRDRYDQFRGISPMSSAMNTLFDLYEAQEYALAKMKLAQLFALKFKHAVPATDAGTDNGDDYTFSFGEGPQVIELEGEDDADFLESATPSVEFQSFMQTGIQVALKSLDIPFSFFDESHTNYSGARQALIQYQQSAESKRESLRRILDALTVWRLQLFIQDGYLTLPPEIQTLDDITFEWIGTGIPWIDPLKEVTANSLAVKSGFTSRQRICKESGEDFFTIADEIGTENEYLKSKGLSTDIENITFNAGDLINADSSK